MTAAAATKPAATGWKSLKVVPSEFAVIGAMATILIVLFTPIPPALLDFLLIVNISFALLVLLLTFYMDKPLAFSTFPSVLLMATLFRLSLNIAATRLILGQGEAGQVIKAIGSFVVAGNYVVGMVVFTILVVVQFVVVTNGAQRVAEVAARFTLDAMPGKQMSIDADLNMGLITQDEARDRRRAIEREANFYGAMDGASKFVKGDAIAGIIIILINIVGGLTIGMVQHGMPWGDALQTYALLTVGDGIVTQIPALVIATGTGIIVTRAATDAQLASEVIQQVSGHPKVLLLVLGALAVALMLPGVPAWPVLFVMLAITILTVVAMRRGARAAQADAERTPETEDLYAEMSVDPIRVDVGSRLAPLFTAEGTPFQNRIATFRRQFALEMGVVLPPVRVKEDVRRAAESYSVSFQGARVGSGTLHLDRSLAIDPGNVKETVPGIEDRDPAFNLPARWVTPEDAPRARQAGYTVVDPTTVIVTHLSELVRQQGGTMLTRAETEKLIARVRETQPTLVEELIPKQLAVVDIHKVLRGLLHEKVPIKSMDLILEALSDAARVEKDPERLQERVRQSLGGQLVQPLVSKDGTLYVLTLESSLERTLREATSGSEGSGLIDPTLLDRMTAALRRQVEAMLTRSLSPVLVCGPTLRRPLKRWVEPSVPQLTLVSSAEIPPTVNARVFATVSA